MLLSCFKVWISRIKRDPKKDFKVTTHTKVCSEHFQKDDFVCFDTKSRRLKSGSCPSVFSWTKATPERLLPVKKKQLEELNTILESELTETASEGEGEFDLTDKEDFFSRATQVNVEMPCHHRFSVRVLLDLADTEAREEHYFNHLTGFRSYAKFQEVLKFVLPGGERKNIVYWNTKASKNKRIDTSLLFDSDEESAKSDDSDTEPDANSSTERTHILTVEDEFLLVLMKLRLGLTNLDLAMRFRVSEGTISTTFITWLNFLYIRLGTLKVWPHRRVILENMPKKFMEDYPNNIIIIDCTELKIQCPSSLVRQSQSYSNYKSTNTLKSLVGVDSKGGFMFVSQLYTGSISDKQIVTRSGFLEVLSRKKEVSELNDGDAIMADKGFDIEEELKKIGLQLNIPPFLKEKPQFNENEVIKTQTIAKHRIHVERAIGKVRNFLIFNTRLPISSLGTINQLWTVCCLLSNFMNPILTDEVDD